MVEIIDDKRKKQARVSPSPLVDGCGRRIDSLRLSVTSACDLKCIYCRPERVRDGTGPEGSLSDAQRVEFVRFLHEQYGLSQVRVTGGEPLVYRKVVSLVAALRSALPDITIAMTTNGQRLYHMGFDLRQAGLDRLNVSLDSIDPDCYRQLTGSSIEGVLSGLASARVVGFDAPKINTVVLRGMNDAELPKIAEWAMTRGSEIRFLEAMPIGPAADINRNLFVPAAEIRARLAEHFELRPLPYTMGETARRYEAGNENCCGVVGFINPVTEPFCSGCKRIRLTADGHLFPCLLDDRSVDVTPLWHAGPLDPVAADRLVRGAIVDKKPEGGSQSVPMIKLGG